MRLFVCKCVCFGEKDSDKLQIVKSPTFRIKKQRAFIGFGSSFCAGNVKTWFDEKAHKDYGYLFQVNEFSRLGGLEFRSKVLVRNGSDSARATGSIRKWK
jgi:hypothetical protein